MKILLRTEGIKGCEPLSESIIPDVTAPMYVKVPIRYIDGKELYEFELVGQADGMPYYKLKTTGGNYENILRRTNRA
jgi:hypothetical protein